MEVNLDINAWRDGKGDFIPGPHQTIPPNNGSEAFDDLLRAVQKKLKEGGATMEEIKGLTGSIHSARVVLASQGKAVSVSQEGIVLQVEALLGLTLGYCLEKGWVRSPVEAILYITDFQVKLAGNE